jgi:hypothetical protein
MIVLIDMAAPSEAAPGIFATVRADSVPLRRTPRAVFAR